MKILLAGEDEFLLKFLKVKFQERGFECDTVTTADEAIKLLDATGYGAIVVDFAIQVQSRFLEGWKSRATRPPVVVLSLLKEETDIQKALDFGINLFINKEHVQMADIVSVTEKIVRGKPIIPRSGFRVPGQTSAHVDGVDRETGTLAQTDQGQSVSEPQIKKTEVVTSSAGDKAVRSDHSVATTKKAPSVLEVKGPDQPMVDVKPTNVVGDRHPKTESNSPAEEVEIEVEEG